MELLVMAIGQIPDTPSPLDFWTFAKSQEGSGWVIAFIIAMIMSAIIYVLIREYQRREKFWSGREAKLVKSLDDLSEKYAEEKDARHEEGLQLIKESHETMTKLSETLSSNEDALKRVTESITDCHRRQS